MKFALKILLTIVIIIVIIYIVVTFPGKYYPKNYWPNKAVVPAEVKLESIWIPNYFQHTFSLSSRKTLMEYKGVIKSNSIDEIEKILVNKMSLNESWVKKYYWGRLRAGTKAPINKNKFRYFRLGDSNNPKPDPLFGYNVYVKIKQIKNNNYSIYVKLEKWRTFS